MEVLEDEFGNKILEYAEGNPLLNANNRFIMISNQLLEQVGATLGESVKMENNPSKRKEMNLLANMIKELSANELKAQSIETLKNNQLIDYFANFKLEIDEEMGLLLAPRARA